jgi:cytochrome c oxidase cbb3-type subunit III
MPPMAAAVGGAEDVRNLAHYVLSLSGSPHDSVRARRARTSSGLRGLPRYGRQGQHRHGRTQPDRQVWLHGWGEEAIVRAVNNGINNQMPGQAALLNERRSTC